MSTGNNINFDAYDNEIRLAIPRESSIDKDQAVHYFNIFLELVKKMQYDMNCKVNEKLRDKYQERINGIKSRLYDLMDKVDADVETEIEQIITDL